MSDISEDKGTKTYSLKEHLSEFDAIKLLNKKQELRSYYTVGTSKVLSIPASISHALSLDKKGYIKVSYATLGNKGIIIFEKYNGDPDTKTLDEFEMEKR